MSFLYFAYGSNMLPARLQARCETARVIGPALAKGFDLEFSKLSIIDGSGKATLLRADDATTPGVVFEIDMCDLTDLDDAEGASGRAPGYDRIEDFTAEANGERITATTYLARKTDPQLRPFDWYLALVIAGAHHHGLGDQHLAKLLAVQHCIDDNDGRETRAAGLAALAAHGFHDHHALLTIKPASCAATLSPATEWNP